METLRESASIVVARSPEELYDMVSDITRMGDWSPVCKACWWDEGGGPRVGATFTGRNELPERTWETTSEVVAAEPGKEFAWVVTVTGTRWGYTFAPVDGGTEITESWEFPPRAREVLAQRFPDDAEAQIASRRELARTGMPATLAAIKQ
ncbi:MAG TPA: SRPBCC family protein, partial [Acidimicrobiia bacterium]|nr:SRPBCC family protein [Acidimicrobiia bacterium]